MDRETLKANCHCVTVCMVIGVLVKTELCRRLLRQYLVSHVAQLNDKSDEDFVAYLQRWRGEGRRGGGDSPLREENSCDTTNRHVSVITLEMPVV